MAAQTSTDEFVDAVLRHAAELRRAERAAVTAQVITIVGQAEFDRIAGTLRMTGFDLVANDLDATVDALVGKIAACATTPAADAPAVAARRESLP